MEDNFEIWKQRLEDDSEYAVPRFDKERVWNNIHPRIKERKLAGWWRYAAAILLGLFIGGGAIKLWETPGRSKGEEHIVTTTNTSITIPLPPNTQTTTVVRQQVPVSVSNKTVKHGVVAPAKVQVIDPVQVAVVEPQIVAPTLPQQPLAPVAISKPVVKAAKPVIHLLDIQNEDIREIVNSGPVQHSRHLFSPKRLPANENNLPSTIVSNYIRN